MPSKTHGMSGGSGKRHPVYNSWADMKQRCINTKSLMYKHYGARGISVCDRWLESFENFRDDMLPTWQEGLSLDRIDNNGNYEPSNCKWATQSEQVKNQRRAVGHEQSACPFISKVKAYKNRPVRWMFKKLFESKEEAEAFYLKIKDSL